jgi:hypothetical protein
LVEQIAIAHLLSLILGSCLLRIQKASEVITPVVTGKKLSKFNTKTFLSTIDGGRKIVAFPKKRTIFAQGDSSDAVSIYRRER